MKIRRFPLSPLAIILGYTMLGSTIGLPNIAHAQVPVQSLSYDEKLALIAEDIEGFAGYYIDDQGELCVRIKKTETDKKLNTKIQSNESSVLEKTNIIAQLENQDQSISALLSQFQNKIRIVESDYSFTELNNNYTTLLKLTAGQPGVVMTDIDEQANRIMIGVESETIKQELIDSFNDNSMQNILKSLVFEIISVAQQNTSLRDSFLDKVAGTQINYEFIKANGSTSRANCTLGFMASVNGKPGFITNSHCSDNLALGSVLSNTLYTQGASDGAPIAQESIDTLSFVQLDPRDINGTCFASETSTVKCRNSDALFAEFLPGVIPPEPGFIAQAESINSGSLDLSIDNPSFRIVDTDSNVTLGQTVFKSGRTTGLTQGAVTRTCVNVNTSSPAKDVDGNPAERARLLCQNLATYDSATGDSGGPVFSKLSNNDVVLHGIHHSSLTAVNEGAFSSLEQIELDLGITLEGIIASPDAEFPDPANVAEVPGIILDNSTLGTNGETLEFPINVQTAGNYKVTLVSNSILDSRLIEVELNGSARTHAIDAGQASRFILLDIPEGEHILRLTPQSNSVSIRHLQVTPILEEEQPFPENPRDDSRFGSVSDSGLAQVPGTVFEAIDEPLEVAENETISIELDVLETGDYNVELFSFSEEDLDVSSEFQLSINGNTFVGSINTLEEISEVSIGQLEAGRTKLEITGLRGLSRLFFIDIIAR